MATRKEKLRGLHEHRHPDADCEHLEAVDRRIRPTHQQHEYRRHEDVQTRLDLGSTGPAWWHVGEAAGNRLRRVSRQIEQPGWQRAERDPCGDEQQQASNNPPHSERDPTRLLVNILTHRRPASELIAMHTRLVCCNMTTLLVANDGGHLMDLGALAPRLLLDDVVWVTVPTPQTESLLEGETVVWAHRADTRDLWAAVRNTEVLRKAISSHRPRAAVSTGSSLALSALPQCAARGVAAHYIESVTRTGGFSLSGRVLRRTPRLHLYTQWPHLADSRWRFRGSVLDGFVTGPSPQPPAVKSVVVSVGTSAVYGFRRLLERVVEVLPDDAEVVWQTGSTDVSGLGIDARPSIPSRQLDQAIARCDVLIAHAGAGISLTALQAGKVPILVPRRPEFDEHVDDHQSQIARFLSERGLAIAVEVDELEPAILQRAAGLATTSNEQSPPFMLDDLT